MSVLLASGIAPHAHALSTAPHLERHQPHSPLLVRIPQPLTWSGRLHLRRSRWSGRWSVQHASVEPLERPLERPARVCRAAGAAAHIAVMMTARHTVMQTGVLKAFPAKSCNEFSFLGWRAHASKAGKSLAQMPCKASILGLSGNDPREPARVSSSA